MASSSVPWTIVCSSCFKLNNFIICKLIVFISGKNPNFCFTFQGRFSYGPFDVAALSSEKVDIHIMKVKAYFN